jgi:hypothetical protein
MDDIRTEMNAQAGPSTTSNVVAATSQDANPDEPPKLSKNAIKKAAKRARAESEKLVRRAAEKERRKANAAKRKADMQAGLLSQEEVDEIRKRQEAKRLRNKVRAKGGNVVKDDEQTFKGGIVIDCGFDELMSEQVSVTSMLINFFANAAPIPGNRVHDKSAILCSRPESNVPQTIPALRLYRYQRPSEGTVR